MLYRLSDLYTEIDPGISYVSFIKKAKEIADPVLVPIIQDNGVWTKCLVVDYSESKKIKKFYKKK